VFHYSVENIYFNFSIHVLPVNSALCRMGKLQFPSRSGGAAVCHPDCYWSAPGAAVDSVEAAIVSPTATAVILNFSLQL
jgi:hypothetical protein